ncbi:hypothetical protein [Azospirillum thermophilum]|uniref:Uncharacterized protein n=1 Tax=Azospirillum thermophilum TaxID=2202148 RepID=A0A2S2CZN9_9PROT|nr:hypothetical protein [Azospirillum thermophilum]AWK89908.1 hypothetical protein DEW08_28240 [Azospirillum thermophilum]
MAEDFDNGPSGIIASPAWQFIRPVPPGKFLRLSFQFNAAWENMIWICNANTRELLQNRGNYFRSRDDFVTDIGRISAVGLVAYHKLISPEASDAGDYPWRQSPMAVIRDDGVVAVVGFNDEGGPGFNQAVCVVSTVS